MGGNGRAVDAGQQGMEATDTRNRRLDRTPLRAGGTLGQRQLRREFVAGAGNGRPDGAAVDVEGCYWTALLGGHRIARLSPTGETLAEYALPVRCPTMVCFGGEDMQTLYITTTRENMDAAELAQYPLSGAIFSLRTDVAGLHKPKFKENQS